MLSKMEQAYILGQYKKYGITVYSWGGVVEVNDVQDVIETGCDVGEIVDEFWDRL